MISNNILIALLDNNHSNMYLVVNMLKVPSVTELSFAEITSKKKSAGLLCRSHICPRNIITIYTVNINR